MLRGVIRDAVKEKKKNYQKKKAEKEKQKRRSRKFGQAPLKHAKRGVESCFLAVLTFFFLILVFSVSFVNKGDVNLLMGFFGVAMFAMSTTGIYKARQGFKERDKDFSSCKAGMVLNCILTLGLILIFLRGLI